MMPERLNDDQRLLFECLRDIWLEQSRKIVVLITATLAITLGIIVGVLWGTQKSLRQTSGIARDLQQQVTQNRQMIRMMAADALAKQQMYDNLIAAFEGVRRQAKRRGP